MQPKYGTIEWEEMYIKNRKENPAWDFKSLTSIYNKFADGKFIMAKCSSTGKWITGEYPVGGFRYMLSIKAALLFNGVWRTKEEAQVFITKRNEKFGDSCAGVEYVEKSYSDPDVLDAVIGNLNLGKI